MKEDLGLRAWNLSVCGAYFSIRQQIMQAELKIAEVIYFALC